MPHVLVYVSLEKMRKGPVHIVCEDQDLLHHIKAYKTSGIFGTTDDYKVDGSGLSVVNQLELRGYNIVGMTSFSEEYHGGGTRKTCCMWTLNKKPMTN